MIRQSLAIAIAQSVADRVAEETRPGVIHMRVVIYARVRDADRKVSLKPPTR